MSNAPIGALFFPETIADLVCRGVGKHALYNYCSSISHYWSLQPSGVWGGGEREGEGGGERVTLQPYQIIFLNIKLYTAAFNNTHLVYYNH